MKNIKKYSLRTLCVLLALCLTVGCGPIMPPNSSGYEAAEPLASGMVFLLDTVVEQKWYGEHAQKTYDEIVTFLTEMDGKFSNYDMQSEISQLNRLAGRESVQLSAEVYAVLARAVALCEQSGGVFDITVAPLAKLWDVQNRTMVPAAEEVVAALALVDYRKILLYPDTHSAMLTEPGMAIDLGAVAKGWLAEEAGRIARANGVTSGYLSLGGNLCVLGRKADGQDFVFGVRNPRGTPAQHIGTVTLQGMTMSTSGDYERFFLQNGERYHHIFDLVTGYPAQKGIISVSVISSDGLFADYFSTKLFGEGLAYTMEHLNGENYAVIAVDEGLNIYISDVLRDKFVFNVEAEGFTLVE